MCCQALHGFVLYTSGVLFVDVYGFTSCNEFILTVTLQVKLVVSVYSLNALFDVVRFVAFVAFLVSTVAT